MVLSRRVLYFGRDQIFWECPDLRACGVLPGGLPLTDLNWTSKIVLEDSREYLGLWDDLVGDYSSMELTYPAKNKLAALSGIAQRVYDTADYFAGLWEPGLSLNLLWPARSPPDRRPQLYQAPSWSWASLNAPVIPCIRPGG